MQGNPSTPTRSRFARNLGYSVTLTLVGLLAASGIAFGGCSSSDSATDPTPSPDGGGSSTTDSGSQGDGSTSSDAANDAAGDADSGSSGPLGAGPFGIAYGGTNVGIDMRWASAATFDGNRMTGFTIPDPAENLTFGTATVNDFGLDGPVAWGRWSGGQTAGDNMITLPANGGFHYVIGRATATLPGSGTATYTLTNKTPVAVSDGSLAVGTASGTLAVAFAGENTKVGASLTLDLPGDFEYEVASTGGSADPTMSQMAVGSPRPAAPKSFFAAANPSIDVTGGGACGGSGTCSGAVNGFIAGDSAERIALVVHIFKGSGGAAKTVTAAFVFTKQ